MVAELAASEVRGGVAHDAGADGALGQPLVPGARAGVGGAGEVVADALGVVLEEGVEFGAGAGEGVVGAVGAVDSSSP